MATPIYNLEVKRDGEEACIGRHEDKTSPFVGEFIVFDSGKMVPGRNSKLHIKTADISYYSDHIHFDGGFPADITLEHGRPHITNYFKSEPRFTLKGFYSTRTIAPTEHESLLVKEIKKFNSDFEFNSIAINDKTRIKLLENSYKRDVSNQ